MSSEQVIRDFINKRAMNEAERVHTLTVFDAIAVPASDNEDLHAALLLALLEGATVSERAMQETVKSLARRLGAT